MAMCSVGRTLATDDVPSLEASWALHSVVVGHALRVRCEV